MSKPLQNNAAASSTAEWKFQQVFGDAKSEEAVEGLYSVSFIFTK